MLRRLVMWFLVVGAVAFAVEPIWAQNSSDNSQAAPAQQQKDQNQPKQSIPDAPSAVQPPAALPQPPPTPQSEQQAAPAPQQPAANEPPPREGQPVDQIPPGPRPPLNVKTVPQGGATPESSDAQDQLFKIVTNVNQVMVPVTVKDEAGHLVGGLLSKDFTVRENGKKQTLNFFTSDPFALSAAIIFDLGMKDVDVQKVNHTFPALEGVFSPFDEISIYSYSNVVGEISSWTGVGEKLTARFESLATASGRNNGPPVVGGPFGPQGPTINNMPVDPNPGITASSTQQESHVLNDAILRAAIDLSKRPRERRKVIFIISDGREYRSESSYRDVLKVLLSNNIMVYAIGVGGSAIPIYDKVSKLHLPRFGYSDILPKYASATGGEVFNELTRTGLEDAYSRLMGDARNQYTLGYISHAPAVGQHNEVEVLVDQPSCRRSSIRPCVDVNAKEGYYAMPAAR
ncbi:MAG TPA: VWA domain-containing protein [Terriglobales bacterium]|nr:VWA domain-containing protein [Terriglobales bacterium]